MKVCYLNFILLITVLSCSPPKELPIDRYKLWIGKEENGLVKFKTVQNVRFTVRYLPGELLAYREWYEMKMNSYDSILNSYKCGMVFQVALQADKQDSRYGNLMHYGVLTQEDLTQRIEFLNFNMESIFSIEYKGKKHSPVLSHFEGFDQIQNQVTFQMSFVLPEFNCGELSPEFKTLRLTFDDPVWDLGINNFEFEGKDIRGIPKIAF